ncbi:MAG: T9SS C-terminal target domain-containing protein [Saprospiraceae bacterium]|nr:T9SS C-terminal target domain-containing protein [Saprospiraceae bacterium]
MNKLMYLLLALVWSTVGMAQQTVIITDASLQGNQTYNWTKNNTYLLDGLVYLEAGGVLNIEAGTVIKGRTVPSTNDLSSSLIITRGAKINAVGTEAAPIIFTGELDDLTITTDVTANDNQLWGGLIILGNSIVGEDGGTDVIEGIPSTETRIQYGGNVPNDNSGTLKYVSIRHGGSVLGADNEINGLTLGGVGSGTVIDYVEVFSTKDDGIEIFGGTVNLKHAVVSFVGDDAFDFDESYEGILQFIFSLTGDAAGEHAVEYDGSEETNLLPKTIGKIYNGTFIGAGLNSPNTTSRGLRLRNDGAVQFWNCIWTDVADYMFRVDDTSVGRLAAGESAFANNIAWNFGAGRYVQGNNATVFAALAAGNTLQADTKLGGIARTPINGLDPRPSNGSPALSGAATPADAGVVATTYRGAFSNSNNWALGWTALSQYGYFGDLAEVDNIITDADIQAGDTLILTNDVEWILDGFVYVEERACLIIEPGTVIKGKTIPSSTDLTSALIVAKGGKIIADGRADAPIIFTGEIDDLTSNTDLTANDNQLWGGLIILGNAPVGEDGGVDVIEGIPSTETRIQYGGNNPQDTSGILRYVSIRHGGSILGADNEINGLTMGGVGNGTIVDYVEVFANKDDGIEIFGGTVVVKHAVIAFVGDDSYDVDEAWSGYGQFIFSLAAGENGMEYDGTEGTTFSCATEPVGRIYNATFIGDPANSISRGARIRNNGSAQIWNSIFADISDYVYSFDANSCGANAVVGNFVAPGFRTLVNGIQPSTFNVRQINPQLAGISRMPNRGLDPRPNAGSPVSFAATYGDNREAARVPFSGAFSNAENWALGWTALDAYGYFGDLATTELKTIRDIDIQAGDTLTLTNTNDWLLDGYVYVEEGACLIIEPGTIVKGKTVPSSLELASALIIARGGKIIAEGTEEAPIIFTGELDDLSSTTDVRRTITNSGEV